MPRSHDTSTPDSARHKARPYSAPRLLVYGALASLTAAGSKGAPEVGGGMAPADKARA